MSMTKRQKILAKVLSGSKNIGFSDFVSLVQGFGFRLSRVNGSHHIFVHEKVRELVNLQEVGGQIKPYQVKQFMNLVERYDLKLEEE
jgi:predicted RNA binding protein YcfA (HicA-like mRNA interferase family)